MFKTVPQPSWKLLTIKHGHDDNIVKQAQLGVPHSEIQVEID